jgi:hypothetical protein
MPVSVVGPPTAKFKPENRKYGKCQIESLNEILDDRRDPHGTPQSKVANPKSKI